eukprot:GHVR01080562.1.p1 GENE.GHVR01080562.1~~GHVR01080562.1.p1  ORF type:complete len:101 (+),score=10.38 GHVR01080562.1:100-402(+)
MSSRISAVCPLGTPFEPLLSHRTQNNVIQASSPSTAELSFRARGESSSLASRSLLAVSPLFSSRSLTGVTSMGSLVSPPSRLTGILSVAGTAFGVHSHAS